MAGTHAEGLGVWRNAGTQTWISGPYAPPGFVRDFPSQRSSLGDRFKYIFVRVMSDERQKVVINGYY